MKRPLTLLEIQAKIDDFVKKRDRQNYPKTTQKFDKYQAIHKLSEYGNYPLCHLRPKRPNLTNIDDVVDCLHCIRISEEY